MVMVQLGGFDYSRSETVSIEAPLTPPLSLGYLKAYALSQDPKLNIKIIEPWQILELSLREITEEILSYSPALIAFSCYIWNIDATLKVIKAIKDADRSIRVIVGGPEISNVQYVEGNPDIDLAVVGPGEEAFYDIISNLALPHVAASANNRLYHSNSFTGHKKYLDNIPGPYSHCIFDISKYRHAYLESYRGCYQKCSYCFYHKIAPKLQFFPINNIYREVKYLHENGIKCLIIIDSVLNYPGWGEQVCQAIAENNKDKQIELSADIQAELVREEFCLLAKKANFVEFQVGLQSIRPETLKIVRRKSDLGRFSEGVRLLKHFGFRVNADLILGLPGDRISDVQRGIDYLKNLGVDNVRVALLRILPGTELWQTYATLGIRFSAKVPYYLESTQLISQKEIHDFFGGANHRVL